MGLHPFLCWLIWNPNRVLFTIPLINRPVLWYGVLFAFGFIAGYLLLIPMIKRRLHNTRPFLSKDTIQQLAVRYVDGFTWVMVAGIIIGARLGHVFFYEWPYYQNHLGEIYKVWTGGLASHGAVIGGLLAVFTYQYTTRKKFPEINFITLLDFIVVPTALAGACVRIGNFFNQEILGTATTLPWGIIFGDPADGSSVVPRHPVQLYEAIVYFSTFILLYVLWKFKGDSLRPGILSGIFFIVVFGSRFFLEFLKLPQGIMIDESVLQTGQYLSIPVVIGGIALLIYGKVMSPKIN